MGRGVGADLKPPSLRWRKMQLERPPLPGGGSTGAVGSFSSCGQESRDVAVGPCWPCLVRERAVSARLQGRTWSCHGQALCWLHAGPGSQQPLQGNGELVAKPIFSPRSHQLADEAQAVELRGLRWAEGRGGLQGLCAFPVIFASCRSPFLSPQPREVHPSGRSVPGSSWEGWSPCKGW